MTAKSTEKNNFAKNYDDLQKIVDWFEKDEIDLEEGIRKFETGMKLVKELKDYLGKIENKVKELKKQL